MATNNKTSLLYNFTSQKMAPQVQHRGGPEYIINAMLMISIIGMGIKMFFGNITTDDGQYGRANATIWGYGTICFAILIIVFLSFAIHDKISRIEKKGASGIWGFIKSFLSSSGPSILTVLLLLWIISLNVFYYFRINKGQVASEYYQLSAGTSFLFIFQIVCLFQYLKLYIKIKTGNSDESEGKASTSLTRLAFAVYFITAINFVVASMMTIILQFFSTDG
jgi:hypothetical protein